jgi:predicted dehydrogenase
MDSVEQLGVGVLGLHEGRTLLVALDRAPHARAVAGCDLRLEKIVAARRDLPDLFLTQSYEEMLRRKEVDIVAIFTPDPLHGKHIIQAFQAGKHVICTKPLVISVQDARDVLAASRQCGRKLLVGQSTRFFESFQRQRQAFERGEVGELELVDAHYIHRMDWYYDKSPWAARSSDWIFLGMSHPIDLLRWYLGRIESVQAYGYRSALARQYQTESFDIYSVNVRSADGRLGRAMGNFGLHELPSARNAIELVLYGSAGTSLAQYHDMRYFHTLPDGTEAKEDMLYSKRRYYFNNEVHGMHYGEFANYTEAFAHALLEGKSYSPNLEEGIETFCLMEAIRQSANLGQPVEVTPLLEKVGLDWHAGNN